VPTGRSEYNDLTIWSITVCPVLARDKMSGNWLLFGELKCVYLSEFCIRSLHYARIAAFH